MRKDDNLHEVEKLARDTDSSHAVPLNIVGRARLIVEGLSEENQPHSVFVGAQDGIVLEWATPDCECYLSIEVLDVDIEYNHDLRGKMHRGSLETISDMKSLIKKFKAC